MLPRWTPILILMCATLAAAATTPPACPPAAGVAVQVLGSGGPIADDARASSGYLVWIDGRSRVLIDAGGGVFLRFGEAHADFAALNFIGLSHFHTDHSADFPALLKSGYFTHRERPLTVAGPSGNARFPGLTEYLHAMLDPEVGAYAYLGGYLNGSGGLPKLLPVEVHIEKAVQATVYERAGIRIDAMPVPHGIVPALAFRVTVGDVVLVFAGDQTLGEPEFVPFAKGASLFVVHMALPEGATSGTTLHAVPSRIGEVAASVAPDTLLISHLMRRSLANLDGNLAEIRSHYRGHLIVAEDLVCQAVRVTDISGRKDLKPGPGSGDQIQATDY